MKKTIMLFVVNDEGTLIDWKKLDGSEYLANILIKSPSDSPKNENTRKAIRKYNYTVREFIDSNLFVLINDIDGSNTTKIIIEY